MSLLITDISHRLPIRVIVPAGMPLSAVFEQTAGALDLSVSELLGWIGVPRTPDPPSRMDDPDWLNPSQLAKVALVTGVPGETITNANLSFFDAALAPSRRQRTTPAALRQTQAAVIGALRVGASTRLCPLCLAEGRRKRLAWRTGWVFACNRHRVLLVDTCPRCGLPFDAHRRHSRVPDLRHCDNHPVKGMKCEQLLTDIPMVNIDGFPKLIQSQGRLEAALTGRTPRFVGQRTTPIEYLRGLNELVDFLGVVALVKSLGPLPQKVLDHFNAHINRRGIQRQQRMDSATESEPPMPSAETKDVSNLVAVISSAFEIADVSNLQAAEDKLMKLIESCCAGFPEDDRRILNYLERCLQRQRRPRLLVALRELRDQVRNRYKIYD